ncbi:DUF4422 domain-containing protein [Candidatus Symbiothrix dinenymphae]|uniref:DUF4422 domain-containing protein n=1 Tax=Candidatus Symbiothrix dinenymphae TaxID=467085 RepID=UPI0006C0D5FB|nr:DUF4422 domain-containing protein [Candidatus Symbiothrix dinenymphae]GAP72119.1 lipopolysaccharide biosynthesis glycosyltransferase [Candidatus Symbiothrix dinenymphae]
MKIYIATHKKYLMPDDELYLPLHVGKRGKLNIGYRGDDDGENISVKNPSFCELTGLYWIWKNVNEDYIGLVHYRRYFSVTLYINRKLYPFESILNSDEITSLIPKYKIIVPRKQVYLIESLYSHYAHTHDKVHLDITRQIIEEKYPDYLIDYDKVSKQIYGYMFNMFIMDKSLLDSYCQWLFDILFELEKRVDISNLSTFQKRLFGRVSEILFNVWLTHLLRHEPDLAYKEIPYIYIGKINWIRKGASFILAKINNRKYEGSF